MTIEELLHTAKIRIRKTAADDLDSDVSRLIDAALEDLKRVGVDPSWTESPSDPLIVEAVLSYVKANFSISDQYPVLIGIYETNLTKIKGASKYKAPQPQPKRCRKRKAAAAVRQQEGGGS
ncbi:hypothetical protein [uncultured Alistipes sp.]|uniref:hypothetical protein n=1 Tax=uncultured Alistipes sp. TaxID=538949 RepID=UPI0032206CED